MTTYAASTDPTYVADLDGTTGRALGRTHIRRRAAGPTADLIALPTREDLEPGAPVERVLAYLGHAEEARRRQLDSLPAADSDHVAAAYRGTVERILEEVSTARRRAENGLYGICADCTTAIPEARLELRPWATTCASCASHRHS